MSCVVDNVFYPGHITFLHGFSRIFTGSQCAVVSLLSEAFDCAFVRVKS